MSAISMPGTTIGTSAFGSLLGSTLLAADAQVRYVAESTDPAFGTHAAATAGVPASDSNRKWGSPPRGEPR